MASHRYLIAPLIAAMAGGCAQNIRKDLPAAPAWADAEACAAQGGKIQPPCMNAAPICVTPLPDGGKPCADSSECVGGCYYFIGSPSAAPSSKNKGVCQRTSYFCGCYQEVEHDKVSRNGFCPA
jgi:hypothetical protein